MYYVYILECSDKTFYTWITTDLERREQQHNWLIPWWAKYTLARKPSKIIYTEKYKNRSEASKREIQIKKMPKAQKESLVNNTFWCKIKN